MILSKVCYVYWVELPWCLSGCVGAKRDWRWVGSAGHTLVSSFHDLLQGVSEFSTVTISHVLEYSCIMLGWSPGRGWILQPRKTLCQTCDSGQGDQKKLKFTWFYSKPSLWVHYQCLARKQVVLLAERWLWNDRPWLLKERKHVLDRNVRR